MQFLLQYSRKTITYAYSGASMGLSSYYSNFLCYILLKISLESDIY